MRTLSQSTNKVESSNIRRDIEQDSRINELTSRVNTLENDVDSIENDLSSLDSYVNTSGLSADHADIISLNTTSATAVDLDATNIDTTNIDATNIDVDRVDTDSLTASTGTIQSANIPSLVSDSAQIGTADITNITFENLNGEDASWENIASETIENTGNINTDTLAATTGISTNSLTATSADVATLHVTNTTNTNTTTQNLEATDANIETLQNRFIKNDENYIDINQVVSDTDFVVIEFPEFEAGIYRAEYVDTVTGTVYFSLVINNTYDNCYFSYYRGFDPKYFDQVAIKDKKIYVRTWFTGRLYYHCDSLKTETPPASHSEWPIDLDDLDYPLFSATRTRATVYTNYVNIGMDDSTFGTAVLSLTTTNDYDDVEYQRTNENPIEYDPNTDKVALTYLPDQNVNIGHDVEFGDIDSTSITTDKITDTRAANSQYLIKRENNTELIPEYPTDNQSDDTALNRTHDTLVTERSIANWNGATNRQYVPGGSGSTETVTYEAINDGKYCFETPSANLRLNSSSHDDAADSFINQNNWNYVPVNAFPFVCEELEVQPGAGTRWHTIYAMPITRDTSTPYSGDATLEALPGYRDISPAPEDEGVIDASQHIYDNYEGLLLLSVTSYDNGTPTKYYARIVVKDLSGYTSASDFVADNSEWFIPKTDGTYVALDTIIGSPVDIFHGQIGPYIYKINNVTFTTISNGGYVLGTSADTMTPFYVHTGGWQTTTSGSANASAALADGKPVGGYVNGKSTPLLWTNPDSDIYILDSFNHFTGVPTTGIKSSTGPVIIVDSAAIDFVSIDSVTGEMTLDWLNIDAQYSSSITHVGKIIEGEWAAGKITTDDIEVDDLTVNNDLSVGNDVSIVGDVAVGGDLTVTGKVVTVHSEEVTTEENTIELRHNASVGLQPGEVSGTIINNYDGLGSDSEIVLDSNGTLRIGDINNTEPVLTRDESANMVDGDVLVWDATGNKAVTQRLNTQTNNVIEGWDGYTNKVTSTAPTSVSDILTALRSYMTTENIAELTFIAYTSSAQAAAYLGITTSYSGLLHMQVNASYEKVELEQNYNTIVLNRVWDNVNGWKVPFSWGKLNVGYNGLDRVWTDAQTTEYTRALTIGQISGNHLEIGRNNNNDGINMVSKTNDTNGLGFLTVAGKIGVTGSIRIPTSSPSSQSIGLQDGMIWIS